MSRFASFVKILLKSDEARIRGDPAVTADPADVSPNDAAAGQAMRAIVVIEKRTPLSI